MSGLRRQSFLSPIVRDDDRPSKRKRLSLIPPNLTLGAPRLLNQPNRRSSILATPTQNSGRLDRTRSSIVPLNANRKNNRSSSAGLGPGIGVGLQTPTGSRITIKKPTDPRPLRDSNFQEKIQNELFEYLSINKFEIEMKHPLTSRSLKSPTQKEFVLIFQWLYNKIDPGYKFIRSIEQEVYSLLRFLEYPYLDTINKSQISAVGGANWHVFLGMLYWLLELVQQTVKFDLENFNLIEETDFNIERDVISKEQELVDKLFVRYALKSYKAFLSFGEDNYDDFYNEMEEQYEEYIVNVQNKTGALTDENEQLKELLDITEKKYSDYSAQIERNKALENDVLKFQNYIDVQKQRRERWPLILEKAQADINKIKTKIDEINLEKQEIINDLQKRDFTLQNIEQMYKERSELTNTMNMLDTQQDGTRIEINNRLSVLSDLHSKLQSDIAIYNNKLYSALNLLSLPNPPDATTLTISPISEEYKTHKFGLSPQEILPTLAPLKQSLNTLKSTVTTHVTTLQNELLNTQETLDDLHLTKVSKRDTLEDLSDQLAHIRRKYKNLSDQYTSDSSTKQLEMENKDKEMRLMIQQLNLSKKETLEKWEATKVAFTEHKKNLKEKRNELYIETMGKLGDVIEWKEGIIESLENAKKE
ncbi:kinetochore-associated Ndc80 complex subunit [Martiniozyma asiatica (nom. inval.)]|nr:kinetochore-associated Ndc80 complex subunit [Martiniozyma asiatica]